MRKIILYIATSLNGKIARQNGSVDWLDKINHPEGEDYGYARFYDRIDTTVMGNKTYQQVLSFGVAFPYKDKLNFVLTRNKNLTKDQNVSFISEDVISWARSLKAMKGKDIWLIGGGELNTLFLNADLIDEIIKHIMPITIPDGIDLFAGKPQERLFTLKSQKAYPSGVVELNYKL
ncbi:dihydrofolate reductase family protein [Portibacter marinus]|uniref:dihydrofolate reductase family protein n=1 Tax=Portibacter marinus TaxID=2898660 RepID=UPI001F349CB5|nr:dihydrofolate reductase family protein [Portibacter marinus]